MRLPRQGYKRARIEIIPMIDVVFFLLVFFMVASLAMTRQTGLPVNLPKASAASRDPVAKITVTVQRDGAVFVDKQPVAPVDLEAVLRAELRGNPKAVLVINADESVRHGTVIAVMDQAKKAGASRMVIATKPVSDAPKPRRRSVEDGRR